MKPFHSISFCTFLLSLYHISSAEEQFNFNNNTISGSAPPFIFSKRTTCSGTCAECYGTGSVFCGDNLACFNPTKGESCCTQYSYSCPDGYYCAPGGQDQQCCDNSISSNACSSSINDSGPATSNSRLSTGAKAGIGIGIALLILIIAGLVTWLLIRRCNRNRSRNRNPTAPAPAQWQMSELAGGPPPSYSHSTNYGAGPSDYGGRDTKSAQIGGGGGPPVAAIYTPGNGLQKAGYYAFTPSHAELPETLPANVVSPAMPYSHPLAAGHDHGRAAEMYGGYTAHELNE